MYNSNRYLLYRIRKKEQEDEIMYLGEFTGWLLDQGIGKRTIEEYTRTVKTLANWFEEGTGQSFDPDEVTARDLHDWISHMQTVQRLAPSTINKRIAAIKTYWRFLMEAKYSTLDPTKPIRVKRISSLHSAPKWLTRREQARLIHLVKKEKNQKKQSRNLAIIQMMLQAGLRISEVVDLDIQDIDLDRKTITIRDGKGGKHRVALMNPDLFKSIEAWLKVREDTENEVLFLSERGQTRMSRQGVHYLVRKYLDQLGLKDYSAHSLRHSFCRNLIDAGQPIQVVAHLAGHESIETTRRYVTPSEHDLRRAVESISEERGE